MTQEAKTLKISAGFWCVFISLFPIVGLAYLITMASASKDGNIKNLARALLILRIVVIIFGTLSVIGTIWLLDTLI